MRQWHGKTAEGFARMRRRHYLIKTGLGPGERKFYLNTPFSSRQVASVMAYYDVEA